MSHGAADAVYVYRQGDFALAFKLFTALAASHDRHGQTGLGRMYMRGEGTAQDYVLAQFWLSKGAERGDDSAEQQLGLLYADGLGVP